MNHLNASVWVVWLTCLAPWLTGTASAQVLHAIVVGDVSPSAGWGKYTSAVAMDMALVSSAITENMPERQVNLVRFEISEDEYSSPANLLETVNELTVGPSDAILFYFTGHGSVDDQGQYLALAAGKLHRKDLLSALLAKRARMVALITDCCNTRSDGYLYAAPYIEVTSPRAPTPLFKSLFLDKVGVVDITSSSPGESAFFLPYQEDPPGSPGSIFTTAWLNWVKQEKQSARSWDDLVRGVSLRVHQSFRDFYPKGATIAKGAPIQTQQNVFAFQYPDMPAHEGPRTGLVVRDFPGRGAVITDVTQGSPATQAFLIRQDRFVSLKPQQVIVSVNGKTTLNTAAVGEAIRQSPQIMRLSVRDPMQGTIEVLVRMKY
ncbi:MAG TPA: hypothetical protein DDZ51_10305 [Planctomycetaceae bacterium]|nr:hypothetical protein [Planctomycetaceae bacterium]